jgi:mannose-6-phosphate isomerase-like protein (cupin superfamily)
MNLLRATNADFQPSGTESVPGVQWLTPQLQTQTLDGRGAIFTWVPEFPILEFNQNYILAGETKGNHFHTEFFEYFLVCSGKGQASITRDGNGNSCSFSVLLVEGSCLLISPFVVHSIQADTDMLIMAMLTKPWDECDAPVTPC